MGGDSGRRALQLAQELIRIDTTPAGDVRPAFELVADRLSTAGFEVSLHATDQARASLVAFLGAPEVEGRCLTGHLDTVPVVESDWSVDPWGGEIRDDTLYGRGATDMKAGLAAMVIAAADLAKDSDLPLRLIVTSEEETGARGARALVSLSELPQVSELIVAEPTGLVPRYGHRGAIWIDVEGHGIAAHGSTPHVGKSAITAVNEGLDWLCSLVAASATADATLGRDTINVGVVHGGTQRNVVPTHAIAEVDVRVGMATYPVLLDKLRSQNPPADCSVAVVDRLSPVLTDRRAAIVREAENLSGAQAEPALYFTDASVLTEALGDVPTLILGPGLPSEAHTADEACPTDQVVRAVNWFYRLAARPPS